MFQKMIPPRKYKVSYKSISPSRHRQLDKGAATGTDFVNQLWQAAIDEGVRPELLYAQEGHRHQSGGYLSQS